MTKHWAAACILFLGAFGLYVHGAYPSVSVGDSGEFIAAGHTLGIAHAPGYPAYVLLAKCAGSWVPWGNAGYRVNLLSAGCGAAAVALLFLIVVQISGSPEAGVWAALVFMLGRAQLVNSQASEVFALHALLCGAVLWAALRGRWLLSAFLLGWGMGNHQTILFLAPAIALAYLSRAPRERASLPALLACAACGISVYAALYFRAAKGPALNAGDPQTLENLWRVFTRADYGSLTLALGETPARTIEFTLRQMGRFFQGLSDQVTWLGVLLGTFGLAVRDELRASEKIMIGIAFALIGPGFFILGNLPFDAQSKGLLERFYIVPTFCWALLMAAGVRWLYRKQLWLGRAAFLLPLLLAFQQARAVSLRDDFRAYSYGRNNLRTLPPNSLFIMDGGDDTFYSLAYLTRVEKLRPDVELRDRGGVVFPGLYGGDFRRLTREDKEKRRRQVEHALLAADRPVMFSTMNREILEHGTLTQRGALYHAALRPSPAPPDMWTFYDLRDVPPWMANSRNAVPDYRTRALLPFYAYQRSVQAASQEDWRQALGFASSALRIGPDVLWLRPNLLHNAYLWAQTNFDAGRWDTAEGIYRTVLLWDPTEATAWTNLGALEERKGRLELAIVHYIKALELDPGSETAHYNLAVTYWKMQNWAKVADELKAVLKINPGHAAARSYLSQAEMRLNSRKP